MSPRLRAQARLAVIFVLLVCVPIVIGVAFLARSAEANQETTLDQRLLLDVQVARRQLMSIADGAAQRAAAVARRADVQVALLHRDAAAIARIESGDPALELKPGPARADPLRERGLLRSSVLVDRGRVIGRVSVFVSFETLLSRLGSPPAVTRRSGLISRDQVVVAAPSALRGLRLPDATAATLETDQGRVRVVTRPVETSTGSRLRLGAYAAADAAASGTPSRRFLIAAVVLLVSAAAAMLALSRPILHSISQLANAAEQADTDVLTGLATRRSFRKQVDLELRRSARTGAALAVILADLDYFKAVNDRFGHGAGDAVLVNFARSIQHALRDGDVAARYGGEEFSILLPAADLSDAARVAERIRAEFARTPIRTRNGSTVYATSSFGVAAFGPDGRTIDDVLHAADNALYAAKAAGRDCVVQASAHEKSEPHVDVRERLDSI
jgi:diguanylate cyclase (GGDEF)-like protein